MISLRDTQYSWNVKKFIQKTPCVRESLLYGIAGGSVVGVGYFLKSSEWINIPPGRFISVLIKGHVAQLFFGGWCTGEFPGGGGEVTGVV